MKKPSRRSVVFPAVVCSFVLLVSTVQAGYLGIKVETLPDSIRSALSADLPEKGGVIVTGLASNSPAAKSGIKKQDILLSYSDKPILSPQEFINNVKAGQANSVVMVKLLRQGETQVLPVTLGDERLARSFPPPHHQIKEFQPKPGQPTAPAVSTLPGNTQVPNVMAKQPGAKSGVSNRMNGQGGMPANFKGLAIRRVGDDIYDASIGVTAFDGSVQRRSFVGTREQILQQITMDRSLPYEARQQLLYAVKPRKKSTGWDNMPFMDGDSSFSPRRFFDFFGF